MIKINLYVGKKPLDITNVGGFDLSQLNIKHLLVAIVLFYVPDMFVYDFFKEELSTKDKEIAVINKQYSALNKRVRSLKTIEKQIKALEVLENQLKKKLDVVREILKIRSNPYNIFLYISKNIPEELWLTEINFKDGQFEFRGRSKSYKSIGIFIENMKNSIFFRKDVKLVSSGTISLPNSGKRIEEFTVSAVVIAYE